MRVVVALSAGGLNRFDRSTERFTSYRHDPDDPASLPDNLVRALHESPPGRLWIGTAGGLSRLDRDSGRFVHYRHDPHDPRSLSHDDVTAIAEVPSGGSGGNTLWVATHGGGLNRLDSNTGTFVRYRHDATDARSLSSDFVYSLYVEASGTVWIGTWDAGLNRFDPERGDFISRCRFRPSAAPRERKTVGFRGAQLDSSVEGPGSYLFIRSFSRAASRRSMTLNVGVRGRNSNLIEVTAAARRLTIPVRLITTIAERVTSIKIPPPVRMI